jgi:hypothetical protein
MNLKGYDVYQWGISHKVEHLVNAKQKEFI